jgi:hypothetical protein
MYQVSSYLWLHLIYGDLPSSCINFSHHINLKKVPSKAVDHFFFELRVEGVNIGRLQNGRTLR